MDKVSRNKYEQDIRTVLGDNADNDYNVDNIVDEVMETTGSSYEIKYMNADVFWGIVQKHEKS